MGRKALIIAAANAAAIAVCILLLLSPLGRKPGAAHPVLIASLVYLMLSVFVAFAGAVWGIMGLLWDAEKKLAAIGLLINLAYVIAVISTVVLAWPALMGI